MAIRQVFAERGAFPVCASCGAEFTADREQLVMEHKDGCSQMGAIAAQWQAREADRAAARV